jgi:hypothetical protein
MVREKSAQVTLDLRRWLTPGQDVILRTSGWGSKTYQGTVVACVPAGSELPLPEGATCRAAKKSQRDRYLVKVTAEKQSEGQRRAGLGAWKELKTPQYMAPVASTLEEQNVIIK